MKLIQMQSRGGAVSSQAVLPQVWATDGNLAVAVATMNAEGTPAATPVGAVRPGLRVVITPETAFYRKYTEAMLQRYSVMKLQKGRVPSLLGRELFRGKVTSYRVHGFDDVVIFVHDVEQCMRLLQAEQQKLVYRIAVQEYTLGEAAAMLKWSLRTTQRRYHEAIDELTAIFQKRGLMDKTPGLKMPVRCLDPEDGEVAVEYEGVQPASESAR